jgi:type IV pilus assembly protein PilB
MHLVTEQDIVQILSKQLRIPFIDLSNYLIDPVIAKLVPEHIAKRHMLIPINKVGNKLTVAMVDPLNIIAIDDIQLMTALMVKPVVATHTDINKALQDAYGAVAQQDKLMDDLEDIGHSDDEDLDGLGELGENDAPIIRLCNLVISQAVQNGVSDIHIEPFEKELRIRYRQMHDVYRHAAAEKSDGRHHFAYQNHVVTEHRRKASAAGRPHKIKVSNRMIDLRVSVLPASGAKDRYAYSRPDFTQGQPRRPRFEPKTLERFKTGVASPYGIILVTGQPGRAKPRLFIRR